MVSQEESTNNSKALKVEGQSIPFINKSEFEEEEHNCTNESKDAFFNFRLEGKYFSVDYYFTSH
jgi:hypothetical protein